jgi:hypothetical protein
MKTIRQGQSEKLGHFTPKILIVNINQRHAAEILVA